MTEVKTAMKSLRGKRLQSNRLFSKKDEQQCSLQLTKDLAFEYYECLDSAVALSCFLLLKHDEYDQLVAKRVNPRDYDPFYMDTFRSDYAAVKFLSKCAGLPTSHDVDFNALQTEAWCEAKCKQTNNRLLKTFPSFHVNRIRCIAQDIISEILGETPTFEEIVSHMRYGPGSSSATRAPDTTIVAKVSSTPDITSEALIDLQYAVQIEPALIKTSSDSLSLVGPICGATENNIVQHSTWTTAPKNAVTSRGIATPIHMLMPFQKSLGQITRRKMKLSRWKLDLDNLWEHNQFFAQMGSMDGSRLSYITLDVKCASSTIAFEPIFDLLPRSWAMLYARYREQFTDYKGSMHCNYKFSAMGNGYTFELESLVFFALAKAAQIYSGHGWAFCSSFGDDIITTKESYDNTVDILTFYGLTVNTEKSYHDGYFRESCGGDYWNGYLVSPPYLKELIVYETDLVKLANRIRHYSSRRNDYLFSDIQLLPCWKRILELLQSRGTSFSVGSKDLGDMVIWARPDEARGFTKPFFNNGQWFTRIVTTAKSARVHKRGHHTLTAYCLQKQHDMLICIDHVLSRQYDVGRRKAIADLAENLFPVTSLPRTNRGTVKHKLQSGVSAGEFNILPPEFIIG